MLTAIIEYVRNSFSLNKKGSAAIWIIVALILVVGVIVVVYLITQSNAQIAAEQTHPFWEVK